MFKVIKIEYFDQFQCSMSACPENCCDNRWDIIVDDDTYNKYLLAGIPNLNQKITETIPHKIIKDIKCPFITEKGLCSLQLQYGEKFLSNTCQSYPRFVSTYGDLYIENLGASCPEVARMLLSADHFLQLREVIYYENEEEQGFRPPELGSERLMKIFISFFSSAEITLDEAFKQSYEFFGLSGQSNMDSEKQILQIKSILESDLNAVQKKEVYIRGDEKVESADLLRVKEFISDRYPFLLHNICIAYLFEHLMLKSKEKEIHYEYAIYEAEMLVKIILYLLAGSGIYQSPDFEEHFIILLYKLMRILDHGSDILKKLTCFIYANN